jgi:hypothetical protein
MRRASQRETIELQRQASKNQTSKIQCSTQRTASRSEERESLKIQGFKRRVWMRRRAWQSRGKLRKGRPNQSLYTPQTLNTFWDSLLSIPLASFKKFSLDAFLKTNLQGLQTRPVFQREAARRGKLRRGKAQRGKAPQGKLL